MLRIDKGNYWNAEGKWNNSPYFNFNDGKLKFNTNWADNANDNYASVVVSLGVSSGDFLTILLSFFLLLVSDLRDRCMPFGQVLLSRKPDE